MHSLVFKTVHSLQGVTLLWPPLFLKYRRWDVLGGWLKKLFGFLGKTTPIFFTIKPFGKYALKSSHMLLNPNLPTKNSSRWIPWYCKFSTCQNFLEFPFQGFHALSPYNFPQFMLRRKFHMIWKKHWEHKQNCMYFHKVFINFVQGVFRIFNIWFIIGLWDHFGIEWLTSLFR